jgi:hypothetical protein
MKTMKSRFMFVMIWLVAAACCCAGAAAASEDFALDVDRRLEGMARSWRQGYAPAVRGNTMTLHLPLRPGSAVGAINARLILPDGAGTPFEQAEIEQSVSANRDRSYPLRFTIPLFADRCNGLYACRAEIAGQDDDGKPLKTAFPVSIAIRDGVAEQEVSPLRIVSLLAEEGLKPGAEGTLTLLLRNTSATQEATDIVLSLADSAGQILPRGSDTLRLPRLLPGEEHSLAWPVTVLAGADARPYQVQVRLSYRDFTGTLQEQSEQFTLNVSHTIALHHSAPAFPAVVRQGSVSDYVVTLMNMGDGDLRHVLLTFDVPGFASGQSVLAGEIPRDESRTVKAALTAGYDTLGDVRGNVRVRYEDAYGTQGAVDIPLTAVIEEKPAPAPAQEQAPEQPLAKAPDAAAWLPWALAGALLLGFIAQSIILRRRIRCLEEEGL